MLLGADVEELEKLATTASQRGAALLETAAVLNNAYARLDWTGIDAAHVRSQWFQLCAPALHANARRLHELADQLRTQAQQQRDASSDTGAAMGALLPGMQHGTPGREGLGLEMLTFEGELAVLGFSGAVLYSIERHPDKTSTVTVRGVANRSAGVDIGVSASAWNEQTRAVLGAYAGASVGSETGQELTFTMSRALTDEVLRSKRDALERLPRLLGGAASESATNGLFSLAGSGIKAVGGVLGVPTDAVDAGSAIATHQVSNKFAEILGTQGVGDVTFGTVQSSGAQAFAEVGTGYGTSARANIAVETKHMATGAVEVLVSGDMSGTFAAGIVGLPQSSLAMSGAAGFTLALAGSTATFTSAHTVDGRSTFYRANFDTRELARVVPGLASPASMNPIVAKDLIQVMSTESMRPMSLEVRHYDLDGAGAGAQAAVGRGGSGSAEFTWMRDGDR